MAAEAEAEAHEPDRTELLREVLPEIWNPSQTSTREQFHPAATLQQHDTSYRECMIRVGRPDDAVALQRACYGSAPVEMIRNWLDPAEETDRVVLVATDVTDLPIGNCTLTRRAHRLERHRAEIGGFVIAPAHRGTGVARQLVDACDEYAGMTWRSETLELGVRGGTHAEDAYRGLGFVEWARMPNGLHDRNDIYDDVRLYRPLAR